MKEYGWPQPFSQNFWGYSVPLLVWKVEKFVIGRRCTAKVHQSYEGYNLSVHDFRLLPWCKLHLCSSGCYAVLTGRSKLTFWALQPVLKHLLLTTNQCCITFQNSENLKFVYYLPNWVWCLPVRQHMARRQEGCQLQFFCICKQRAC